MAPNKPFTARLEDEQLEATKALVEKQYQGDSKAFIREAVRVLGEGAYIDKASFDDLTKMKIDEACEHITFEEFARKAIEAYANRMVNLGDRKDGSARSKVLDVLTFLMDWNDNVNENTEPDKFRVQTKKVVINGGLLQKFSGCNPKACSDVLKEMSEELETHHRKHGLLSFKRNNPNAITQVTEEWERR